MLVGVRPLDFWVWKANIKLEIVVQKVVAYKIIATPGDSLDLAQTVWVISFLTRSYCKFTSIEMLQVILMCNLRRFWENWILIFVTFAYILNEVVTLKNKPGLIKICTHS